MSISDRQFQRVSKYVYESLGIHLSEEKRSLVEGRLHKRMRLLKLNNFRDYCNVVFESEGNPEQAHFIDAITTHETYFYREPDHFHFLESSILPEMILKRGKKKINIWSAACSSGEESYTLGIVIENFRNKHPDRYFDYEILGTDVAKNVIQTAQKAVYSNEDLKKMPLYDINKYFLKSRDPRKGLNKIVPEIQKNVHFGILNLASPFQLSKTMDIIFCRNMFIYFDKISRDKSLTNMMQYLNPGGYFFIGCSENIHQVDLPIQRVAHSVFKKLPL